MFMVMQFALLQNKGLEIETPQVEVILICSNTEPNKFICKFIRSLSAAFLYQS